MPDLTASLSLLDATVFLYPSYDAAKSGTEYGGSGVIVGFPLENLAGRYVRYVVTNWHVVCKNGSSVIRVNSNDGQINIIDKDPSEWTFLPGKQDLAAIILDSELRPSVVHTSSFVGGDVDAYIGDDVFMVGRFVDFDGGETNKPAVRFGAVSMMNASVVQPTGFCGDSIIVDMRCRDGFSGSPVYIYRAGTTMMLPFNIAGGSNLPKAEKVISTRKWGVGNNTEVRLLGILWGQFSEKWDVRIKPASGRGCSGPSIVEQGAYVNGFSGMSCVVPAAQILEILNHRDLRRQRDDISKQFLERGR